MGRPKANSVFFKTWSSDMAYVLGFIATDGCLTQHKNGYNGLNITNKDKNILKYILGAMRSNHKIGAKARGGSKDKKYFQIQIRDKIIYEDLLKLGLTPRKSKTIRMPDVLPELFGDFIRGCLDGDGTVVVWQDPRWKHAWQMSVRFFSGSKNFLIDIQQRLHKEFGLTTGSIQRSRRSYALCYSIADCVKLYRLLYKKPLYNLLFLWRKWH
ncbi:MAG: hypothetical protein ABH875_04050, partial [Candidatus Omnitrophota bacterium]